nr:MAG TPA: hypothetical protein [Caudoviricetes sp.]
MLFKTPEICYNILINIHFILEIYFFTPQI